MRSSSHRLRHTCGIFCGSASGLGCQLRFCCFLTSFTGEMWPVLCLELTSSQLVSPSLDFSVSNSTSTVFERLVQQLFSLLAVFLALRHTRSICREGSATAHSYSLPSFYYEVLRECYSREASSLMMAFRSIRMAGTLTCPPLPLSRFRSFSFVSQSNEHDHHTQCNVHGSLETLVPLLETSLEDCFGGTQRSTSFGPWTNIGGLFGVGGRDIFVEDDLYAVGKWRMDTKWKDIPRLRG